MREILFRGKHLDNGEWVEGHYHYANWYLPPSMKIVDTTHHILPIGHGDAYKVAPETVGQFTGLLDGNNKRIFENDIVRTTAVYNSRIGKVVFINGSFSIFVKDFGMLPITTCVTVIGNIYDNQELME